VMFCDLVGSTPLAQRFDPEDLREIVGAYHHCVADTVARFAGFVANIWATGCWSTSATRKPTKTTPSARSARGSL
jgi:class 3 adenylate cyclase